MQSAGGGYYLVHGNWLAMKPDGVISRSNRRTVKDDALNSVWGDDLDDGWNEAPPPPPASTPPRLIPSPLRLLFGTALGGTSRPIEPGLGDPEANSPATETLRPANLDRISEPVSARSRRWLVLGWWSGAAVLMVAVGSAWTLKGDLSGATAPGVSETGDTSVISASVAPRRRDGDVSDNTQREPAQAEAAIMSFTGVSSAAASGGSAPLETALASEAPPAAKPRGRAGKRTPGNEGDTLKSAFAAALVDNPRTVNVTVTTQPSTAAVFDIAGRHLGVGTVDVSVPEGRQRRVMVFRDGYQPKRLSLDARTRAVSVKLVRLKGASDSASFGASGGSDGTGAESSDAETNGTNRSAPITTTGGGSPPTSADPPAAAGADDPVADPSPL